MGVYDHLMNTEKFIQLVSQPVRIDSALAYDAETNLRPI